MANDDHDDDEHENENEGRQSQRDADGVGVSIFEEFFETLGTTLGAAGYELPLVQSAINVLNTKMGPRVTGLGLAGLNIFGRAGIQAALNAANVRADIAEAIAESAGGVFEGLRTANYYNLRGKKLHHAVRRKLNEGVQQVQQRLSSSTYDEALLELSPSDFTDLDERLSAMTAEERKQFDAYKRQITSLKKLKVLLDRTKAVPTGTSAADTSKVRIKQMFAFLARHYTAPVNTAKAVENGWKKLTSLTGKVCGTAEENDRQADEDQAHIRARRARAAGNNNP
jgi:hypothetical protein